jgi:hypothetical protein
MLISEVVSSWKDRDDEWDEKNDQRCKLLLNKDGHKIKLKEPKVEAPKITSQARLIHSMNDSLQATVTKMKEDSKILTQVTLPPWMMMLRRCTKWPGLGS